MQEVLDWSLFLAGWGLFTLLILAGLALDLVGLFGNWLILGALGGAWLVSGLAYFNLWTLGGGLALAILGEVLESALAGYGAAKFGGSRGAIVAALAGTLVGAVVGTPWFPIIGTLAGACLGAFAFAAVYEIIQHEKDARTAAWTGVGAALGKVGGLFAKLFCGVAMLILAAFTF